LFRVVTSDAVGAPVAPLPPPVAPIAPEPFVPEGSVPVNVTTVIDDTTFCDRLAVTVALLSTVGAKARQISASPGCALVRFTSAQVNPPPVTPLTVMPPEEPESDEMNANNNSFTAVVENAGVVTVVLAEVRSVEVNASIAS
jgi:DNA-binding transcriptional regulator YdaS (Cro superfamily)